jgi:hypothetical protein
LPFWATQNRSTIMSTYIATDPTFGIRALADAEVDAVNGGNLVVAGGAAFLIGFGIGYMLASGNVTDGVRAALEGKGLR